MVNFAIFCPLSGDPSSVELRPQTAESLRIFTILLGDFLSPIPTRKGNLPFGLELPPENGRVTDFTFLFYLRRTCERPSFAGNTQYISQATESFSAWLEGQTVIREVWFPSVQVKLDLSIQRRDWIRICGDVAKHNFARLEANVRKIERILAEHGVETPPGAGYLMLPEFYEWFHSNAFAYLATKLAEFLNEVRWAIFAYLRTEFERSYIPPGTTPAYGYAIPKGIGSMVGREMWWELMNRCRSDPWFPQFKTSEALSRRF